MADKITEAAQAVFQAQNELIGKGFSVAGAGFDQMTGMARSGAEALQVEAREARQAWDGMLAYAQTRSGKAAELAKEMAAVPASGDAAMEPETRDLALEIAAGDSGFLRDYAEYVMGVEKRRVELMSGMLKTNTALVESGQDMAKSAFDYGQALIQWSAAITKGASPPEQD